MDNPDGTRPWGKSDSSASARLSSGSFTADGHGSIRRARKRNSCAEKAPRRPRRSKRPHWCTACSAPESHPTTPPNAPVLKPAGAIAVGSRATMPLARNTPGRAPASSQPLESYSALRTSGPQTTKADSIFLLPAPPPVPTRRQCLISKPDPIFSLHHQTLSDHPARTRHSQVTY